MSSIPLPALAVQPQTQDPIAEYGKVVALKSLMQQQQYQQQSRPLELQQQQQQVQAGQQNLESGALDLALRKQVVDGYGAVMNSYNRQSNPASGQPFGSPTPSSQPNLNSVTSAGAQDSSAQPEPPSVPALSGQSAKPFTERYLDAINDAAENGKITPYAAFEVSKGVIATQNQLATLNKNQMETAQAQQKQVAGLVANVLAAGQPQTPDEPFSNIYQRQKLAVQQAEAAVNNNPDAGKVYGPSFVQGFKNFKYDGPQSVESVYGGIQAHGDLLEEQAKALANAKAGKELSFPDVQRLQTNSQINSQFLAQTGKPAPPEALLKPGDGQLQLDNINKMATGIFSSPAVAGRKAGAEAWARVGPEVAAETQKLQAQQKMYPSPTVGVAPHLVGPATTEATKRGQEYVAAQNAADEMQSIIDLARGGNKVAYAYAPTTGVLTINAGNQVKRVNMAEIQQYGGAGSLLDRLQGKLGKAVNGASIPSDVLNDMEQLHQQLGQNSLDTYKRGLAIVNGTYGSQFQPVTLPPRTTTQVPNANKQPQTGGNFTVTTKDGLVHNFASQQQANAFDQAATQQGLK